MSGAKRQLEQQFGRPPSVGELIGRAVRQRREALDLTQIQLAILADLSEGSVRNVENGTVEPRQRTWGAIQAALGWAPGSLDAIQKGISPVEILPVELLKEIIIELIFGQSTEVNTLRAIRDFRDAMSTVNERGEFTAENAKKFVGFIYELGFYLVAENTEYEQIDENDFNVVSDGGYKHHVQFVRKLETSLKIAHAAKPTEVVASGPAAADMTVSDQAVRSTASRASQAVSATSTLPETFSRGDRVYHQKFGLGTVAKLGAIKLPSGEMLEGAQGAEIDFDDYGVKLLDLRHAHLKHVGGSRRIPKELENTLRRVQIIDYLVSTPLTDEENLIVIAVLAKRDPDRALGHRDVATFAGFADMKKRGVVAPNLEDIDTVIHDETEA